MTAACNGCGACCSPVTLSMSQEDVRRKLPGQLDARTRRWILEELTPISRREGKARAPWVGGGMTLKNGRYSPDYSFFYECKNFDPVTRLCAAYDDRPEVCSGYPWYQAAPNPGAALPPYCSYREDIGKSVEPQPDWQTIELTRKAP